MNRERRKKLLAEYRKLAKYATGTIYQRELREGKASAKELQGFLASSKDLSAIEKAAALENFYAKMTAR